MKWKYDQEEALLSHFGILLSIPLYKIYPEEMKWRERKEKREGEKSTHRKRNEVYI